VVWQADGRRLDPRLLALLRALQSQATLKAAAEELGMSYRGAWGLLLEAAALAGAPLAELERGRGARLTHLGAQLLRTDERLREAMEPLRERFEVQPGPAQSGGKPLRLAASHDPLLAEFCERFALPAGLIDEVSFRGSEESLARYARGAADVAGFHFSGEAEAVAVRRLLRPRRDRLVRFAEREQGLIVAHGNPKRLASLSDIAHRHARFVNRQRGSGTRRLADRLLRESGIAPESIVGYGTEDYTHRAVAATVATGRADAGLGVHAAASELGLDFVPLALERYWLVLREPLLGTPAARALIEGLAGKPLARIGRSFVGYDFRGAGEIVPMEKVFS
jgi:molybdate transport repressor ModE-like protein